MATNSSPSSFAVKSIYAALTVLMILTGWAILAGERATITASEAKASAALAAGDAVTEAKEAKTALLIHEGKQNGTLEAIRDHMKHQDASIEKLDIKMEKMDEKATQRQAEIIQLLTE